MITGKKNVISKPESRPELLRYDEDAKIAIGVPIDINDVEMKYNDSNRQPIVPNWCFVIDDLVFDT